MSGVSSHRDLFGPGVIPGVWPVADPTLGVIPGVWLKADDGVIASSDEVSPPLRSAGVFASPSKRGVASHRRGVAPGVAPHRAGVDEPSPGVSKPPVGVAAPRPGVLPGVWGVWPHEDFFWAYSAPVGVAPGVAEGVAPLGTNDGVGVLSQAERRVWSQAEV